MTELSVSILSADLANLAAETADSMVCGADMVHFDVMDGHFVPNITYGAPVLKCLKKAVPEAFYDVHLMISDPARYAQDFATAGANLINFHIEAVPNHVGQTIAAVRETGCLVGLTISPSTPPQAVFPYLDELDLVLVMGWSPALAGRSSSPQPSAVWQPSRQSATGAVFPRIEVDGGINTETASCVPRPEPVCWSWAARSLRRRTVPRWPNRFGRCNPKGVSMPKRHDKITKSVNYDYYWDILFCTVPLLAVSCFYYGARPLLMMAAGLLTAYVADCVVTPLHAAGYRAHEPSSEAFAALIVLMMPASAPYYMVVTATIIAVLVKEAFGGEGHYPFHPAAVGLVAATLAWPRDMSSYPAPGTVLALFSSTGVVLTQGSNTTLSAGGLPSDSTINLLTGNVAGPLGCCAILVIVACGLYLLVRGHMQLSTFVPYLAVCVLVPWLLPNLNELPALSAPWEYVRQRIYLEKYILLSGSMLFGGIFLACEPVVQPNRWSSRLIYGLFLGAMATAFRYYSVYETGVCFAIVLAGAFPEWLDRLAQRAERIRFMRKEEKRLAQHREP